MVSALWIFLPVIFSDAPIYRQNIRDQFIGNIFTSVISKILANYRQTIIDAILTTFFKYEIKQNLIRICMHYQQTILKFCSLKV